MLVINARNVNEALRKAVMYLTHSAFTREISPRDLPTIEYKSPVTTVYQYPRERVCTIPERDANPFFHFFEALWMLHGDSDVAFVSQFNSNISDFSDDGITFHGAYGRRWRKHFGIDQLMQIVAMLRRNVDTRQAVLQIWDCVEDLDVSYKDIPCNDVIFFKVRDCKLEMTVCCRSNDAIWGAYGANAVHFSMLQEVIAGVVGVDVGIYRQVSDSLHVYTDNPQWEILQELHVTGFCPYFSCKIKPYPVFDSEAKGSWFSDLDVFMHAARNLSSGGPYNHDFFEYVAHPMLRVWRAHKNANSGSELVKLIAAEDWRWAVSEWLKSREPWRIQS